MRASNESRGHPDDDRLIDLLFGLIAEPEARRDIAHLRGCADCEVRFRALVREHETLRSSGSPRVVGGAVVRPPADEGGAGRAVPARIMAAGWAAAAILALTVVLLARPTGPGPALAYWLPLERELMALRSDTVPEDLERLGAGLEAYRQGDAVRAVELLETAEVPESFGRFRDLVLASALTLAGRHDDAIGVLRSLEIERLPMPWRSRAAWVSYTAHRDGGHVERAALLLDDLVTRDDEIGRFARNERARLGSDGSAYSGRPKSTNPPQ